MRLRLGRRHELNWNYGLDIPAFRDYCRSKGLELVEEKPAPVSFIDIRDAEEIDGPTILFDREDTSLVTPWALTVGENNPNVIGYAVPTLSTDPARSIANEIYNSGEPIELPTKPVMVFNSMPYWRLARYQQAGWSGQIATPEVRTITASCYCHAHNTLKHGTSFIAQHRLAMARNWDYRDSYLAMHGNWGWPLNNEHLLFLLTMKSKVAVCPWGRTEICQRDYDALFAGTMIVKPQQSEILTNFSPWMPRVNVVYCAPDFHNLEGAVREAAAIFDESHERLAMLAKQAFMGASDIRFLAKSFVEGVRKILKSARLA